MLGTAFATNVAGYSLMGIEGWRWAFRFVAVNAAIIGVCTLIYARDPTVRKGHHVAPAHDHKFTMRTTAQEFWQVVCPAMILR